jgi:hypothetical protein
MLRFGLGEVSSLRPSGRPSPAPFEGKTSSTTRETLRASFAARRVLPTVANPRTGFSRDATPTTDQPEETAPEQQQGGRSGDRFCHLPDVVDALLRVFQRVERVVVRNVGGKRRSTDGVVVPATRLEGDARLNPRVQL